MGVTEHPCKSHNFQNFTYFSLGYIEEKNLKLSKFSGNFYDISYDDSKDIIRTYNDGHFAFLSKKCGVLNKNYFFSQNYRSFKTTTVNEYREYSLNLIRAFF